MTRSSATRKRSDAAMGGCSRPKPGRFWDVLLVRLADPVFFGGEPFGDEHCQAPSPTRSRPTSFSSRPLKQASKSRHQPLFRLPSPSQASRMPFRPTPPARTMGFTRSLSHLSTRRG